MAQKLKLAILCAGGDFPRAVAQAVLAQGARPFLLLLKGLADPHLEPDFDSAWVGLGQFGKMLSLMHGQGCTSLVSVGSLVRPKILSVLPDFKMISKLPFLLKGYHGGDNHLLTHVARLFENEGILYKGVHEVAPQLLMPSGVLTLKQPTSSQLEDITYGLKALETMGDYDIGQALILHNKHIVALEGAEGTDGLLARMASMRENRVRWPRPAGILVKALKPNQDKRLDMPAIGVNTIKGLKTAGLAGLAVQAGATLMLDGQEMIEAANEAGIFIIGV